MYCPKCKAKNDEGAKFCGKCGCEFEPAGNPEISRTNITYTNDSKKSVACHCCGKNMPLSSAFTCRNCGNYACIECFSKNEKVCFDCVKDKVDIDNNNLVSIRLSDEYHKILNDEKFDDDKKHEICVSKITAFNIPINKIDFLAVETFMDAQLTEAHSERKSLFSSGSDRDVQKAFAKKMISLAEQSREYFGTDRDFISRIEKFETKANQLLQKRKRKVIFPRIVYSVLFLFAMIVGFSVWVPLS